VWRRPANSYLSTDVLRTASVAAMLGGAVPLDPWLSPLLCATADSAAAASPIGFGLPSCQMLCPSSPALGQLRNRKQPRRVITIARVDAKDILDGDVVIGLLQNPDRVSGTHIALGDDSE